VNSVLLKQRLNFLDVEGSTAIVVKLVEHVVDDVVRFYLGTRVVIVRMRILARSRLEPLLEDPFVHLQFSCSALASHFRWISHFA
jgi:hypothetical protein